MPIPIFDKSKQQKIRKLRMLIFGLVVAALGLFGGIYYRLHKLGSLSALFQTIVPSPAPIIPAPTRGAHCPLKFSPWTPYFFHEQLIYCDSNYKCRVKTGIKANTVSFADRFSDGLARLGLKNKGEDDSIVYIGTSGKIEIDADPERETSGPFSEGLAYSVDRKSSKLGFIDKHGKYVIVPQFSLSLSTTNTSVHRENQLDNCVFSSGLAPVYTEEVNSARPLTPSCGYIDHKGKFVIPSLYLEACAFVEERARICAKDESKWRRRWGYIDPHGKRVIKSVYMEAQDFSEGLASVLDYQGKWGFVDKTGRYMIPAKFSDADSFSQGLCAVAVTTEKKLWGYIHKDGTWLIQPRFDRADAFQDDEAYASCGDAASKSKEDYWINKEGKLERHRRQLIPFDIEDLPLNSK